MGLYFGSYARHFDALFFFGSRNYGGTVDTVLRNRPFVAKVKTGKSLELFPFGRCITANKALLTHVTSALSFI